MADVFEAGPDRADTDRHFVEQVENGRNIAMISYDGWLRGIFTAGEAQVDFAGLAMQMPPASLHDVIMAGKNTERPIYVKVGATAGGFYHPVGSTELAKTFLEARREYTAE